MKFNRKAFEEDYAILDGIPEERFKLQSISNSSYIRCDTLACGVGWLLLHPKYTSRGYKIDALLVTYRTQYIHFVEAPMRWYGITRNVALGVFRSRAGLSSSPYDPPNARSLSDKKLLLARMRNFLGTQPCYSLAQE